MNKTAIITGVTGQTGSYLADLLIEKNYKVYGVKRRSSSSNYERIGHILNDPKLSKNFELVDGDLSDYGSIVSLVSGLKPDLFFNMAAQSHVRVSFDMPEYTMDITGSGVIRCLEAIRKYSPTTKFLQASTSEMFGNSPAPQNELTEFNPRSPYGVAKLAGYYGVINYRDAYNLFACNTICFNHESPRRGEEFVTRKITKAAARIKLGLQDELWLGNLDAKRDWGHAKDYADAMISILEADSPNDYVVATGETHSIKEFLELVFKKLDLKWEDYVKFDPKFLRPSEVNLLQGDAGKIKKELNWSPKISFEKLVEEMVNNDLEFAKKEKLINNID